MIKNKFFPLIAYIGIFLLLYMIIFAMFVKTPEMLAVPSYIILGATVVFLFVVLGVLYFIYKKVKPLNRKVFLIIVALVTLVPRLIWVVFIDTAPISDYYGYNNYAINASKGLFHLYGEVYPLFPFKFGYSLILSVLYRIFGTDLMVAKLFNVVLSLGTVFLIYKLGEKLFNERSGRIASLIFAFWPAQIMYNSVVASEHIFIFFFLLAMWFFTLVIDSEENIKNYILAAASGAMIALAYLIRPVSMILLPIMIICLFIFSKEDKHLKNKKKGTRKKTIQKYLNVLTLNRIKISATAVVSTIITIALINLIVGNIIGVRLWKSSSGFSFYIGTNYESSGMYSAKDEEIIEEFNYDFDEVHGQATRRAIERIVSRPADFLRLIERKFIIQWTNEDYGYYWSMYKLNSVNNVSGFVLSHPRAFLGLSQIYYIAMLIIATVGSLYIKRHKVYSVTTFYLLLIAFVGSHTLFEVQSRYHYPVMPFLIIIGSYGVEQIMERLLYEKDRRGRFTKA